MTKAQTTIEFADSNSFCVGRYFLQFLTDNQGLSLESIWDSLMAGQIGCDEWALQLAGVHGVLNQEQCRRFCIDFLWWAEVKGYRLIRRLADYQLFSFVEYDKALSVGNVGALRDLYDTTYVRSIQDDAQKEAMEDVYADVPLYTEEINSVLGLLIRRGEVRITYFVLSVQRLADALVDTACLRDNGLLREQYPESFSVHTAIKKAESYALLREACMKLLRALPNPFKKETK